MGMGAGILRLLPPLHEAGLLPEPRRIVEIGAQQLSQGLLDRPQPLASLGPVFGRTQPYAPPPVAMAADGTSIRPLTRDFWIWLGFDHCAIDTDGSPGALPLDLNYDRIPADMKGRSQLVTNLGTTEHVANQLNALEMIHDLTAYGGVMIHRVPAQGMMNHGLVNYNPKFFWMLARSNGYHWLHFDVSTDGESAPLPRNVMDHASAFTPDIAQRMQAVAFQDGQITLVLQKVYDIPFVAPIDMPAGAPVDERTRERYWTVFRPDAFESLPRFPAPSRVQGLGQSAP